MKKRILSLLLALVLMCSFVTPVFAAGTDGITLHFSLEALMEDNPTIVKDSDYDITAPAGTVITIKYYITNTNTSKKANIDTSQDEILYDHNFFEYVDGSAKILAGDYEEAFSAAHNVGSPGDGNVHLVKFNNSSYSTGIKKGVIAQIGEFKLKIKDSSTGTSVIQNTNIYATLIDTESTKIDFYNYTYQNLTVTVAGSAAHTCTGVWQPGLTPTETSAGYRPYYQCSCNRRYEDENCTKEIENLEQWKGPNGAGYLPMLTPIANAQYFASLTLNENINVNFKMTGMSQNFEFSKLVVKVDGQPIAVSKNESGEVVGLLKAVAPKDMGKPMTIAVEYDGKVEKTIENYSVKKYCQTVLQSEDYGPESKLGELCKAVLNYGKWAEDYFNEKNKVQDAVESKTNENYPIDFSEVVIPQTSGSFTASTAVTEAGGYLTLNSTVALNFEIKTTKTITKDDLLILNNENKKVDPANITLTPIEGGYKIQISNIGASKLSRTYTLTIKGDNTFEVTYSVYTYCYNAQSNQGAAFTATLKTLCKAIYSYGEAAKAYTASLSK